MHGPAGWRGDPQFIANQKKSERHRKSFDLQNFEEPGFNLGVYGNGGEDGQAEA